jgi:hypothetical protein
MARELGLSPKRFAVYADRKDQPWKLPLGQFIQSQYEKQFEKPGPDVVMTMEEIAAAHVAKRAARKQMNLAKAKAEESKTRIPVSDVEAEAPEAEVPAASPTLTDMGQASQESEVSESVEGMADQVQDVDDSSKEPPTQ